MKRTPNTKLTGIAVLIAITTILSTVSCVSREEKAKQHLEAGIALTLKSEFEGALAELNQAISYDPKNADAYYYRANTYYNLYEVDLAIKDYGNAIELNPEHMDALTNRGNAKFYIGDIAGACEDWKKAKALGKKHLEYKMRFCK